MKRIIWAFVFAVLSRMADASLRCAEILMTAAKIADKRAR